MTDETHRHKHMDEILKKWSGATMCPWPNCSSKATFKFPTSLKTHLSNIHVTPLICKQPGCSYSRPFSKQYELNRHISTAHREEHHHKCPIDTCEASITGFARKDKLIKHLREEHENLRCPYNHCFAMVLAGETQQHLTQSHGNYECALQECKYGGASRFSRQNLKRHLRRDHQVTSDPAFALMLSLDNQKLTAEETLTRRWKQLRDCATCASRSGTTSREQDS
jgi:hypothetical protein